MGRTLKRVPMDFSWPTGKVWHGYINPYYARSHKCAACGGTGYSPQARLFSDQWYGKAPFDPIEYGATPLTVDHPQIQAFARHNCERSPDYYGTSEYAVTREARRLFDMWRTQWSRHLIQVDVDALLAANRLYDFTRVPRTDEQRATVKKKIADGGNAWLPESNGYRPTADEVNAWSLVGFGHDAINQWVCVKARCAREGVETACSACNGEGDFWINPEDKKLCEEWERSEPPTGDGFQLWSTTSEGEPSSPVFATIEELCVWCETNATTFGSAKASAQQWRDMLDENFVVHVSGNYVFM